LITDFFQSIIGLWPQMNNSETDKKAIGNSSPFVYSDCLIYQDMGNLQQADVGDKAYPDCKIIYKKTGEVNRWRIKTDIFFALLRVMDN